jgi:glycosyltransferase involved in cell wall biosynthesis
MKIAFYTSNRLTLPPSPDQAGASMTITASIVKCLRDKHEITVYAAKGSRMEGVVIKDLDLPPFNIDSSLANADWTTKAVLGMKQIPLGALMVEADQYDIIHLQNEPVYLGMAFANVVKTPILFTSHHPFFEIDRPIYEYYDGKVNFSALSRAQAEAFPFVKNEVQVVYNGIETKDFSFVEQDKGYFLFVGRLVEEKGILDFLKLAEKFPGQKFVVAGSGPLDVKVKEAVASNRNIEFRGWVARKSPEWFSLFGEAKALVLPVIVEESFGLVSAEAMAGGTPVIAYDRGAVAEVIGDESTGFVVPFGDFEGLASSIEKMINMPDADYSKMRQAARNRILENFSEEKMALGYEKLYEEIIAKNKK